MTEEQLAILHRAAQAPYGLIFPNDEEEWRIVDQLTELNFLAIYEMGMSRQITTDGLRLTPFKDPR